MIVMSRRSVAFATTLTLPLLALAACGDTSSDSASGGDTGGDKLSVVTSFYPLQYAVQQVGGDHVDATNLTKPGTEPHDLELSPQDTLSVSKADAVIYLSGFQPAVDDAVKEAGDKAHDVHDAARLDLKATDDGHDHGGDHADHDHADEGDHADEEHAEGNDPHFWLDPNRYADVADAIAADLSAADPDNAADYKANAKDLRERLGTLNTEFKTGLASCEHKDLVTSHAAFGYLAKAYGFDQEGITGITPESEPSAKQMADIVAHIKEHKVPTIYAETLVPRDVADTIAKEANATVMVLDPIEGITDESAAQDYFGVMRANLETLKKGQVCS